MLESAREREREGSQRFEENVMNTFVSICESGAGRKTGHVLERERERETS